MEIKHKILEVMSAVFDIPESEIPEDCSYGSIEKWDSLGHMNLIVAIEEEFNIRFSDEEFPELLNPKLIELIVSKKIEESNIIN